MPPRCHSLFSAADYAPSYAFSPLAAKFDERRRCREADATGQPAAFASRAALTLSAAAAASFFVFRRCIFAADISAAASALSCRRFSPDEAMPPPPATIVLPRIL
jgi:hypothetical protein